MPSNRNGERVRTSITKESGMSRLYRYVQAVPRRAATGQVSAVYAQIARDLLLTDGPLLSLSPAPEILTTTWALLREAQIAGRAERSDMEVIATAVSKANHCAYCVVAHTALIHATGKHDVAEDLWHGRVPDDPREARLVTWAMATGTPGAASTPKPYADALSPE
jgi:AhpD family alkylhydroperoxidase